jgi:hypothetical protein
MVEKGLDIGGCVEVLFWVLMTDPNERTVTDPERMWLLARLLRVGMRGSDALRERLEGMLLRFLTAGEEREGDDDWSPEEFRGDVLGDLGLSEED